MSGNTLEIIHVEVGQLPNPQKTTIMLQKKFSPNVCNALGNYFRQKLGFTHGNVKYNKMYVASFWSKGASNAVMHQGIEFRSLPNFICNEVLQAIQKWKKNPPFPTRTKGAITLSEGNWLLQLIDFLSTKKLLKCP